MKYLILLFTFLMSGSLFAQELPDTIIYVPLPNGNFDVVEGNILRNVTLPVKEQIEKTYASNRLNALSALKDILVNIKAEIKADSVAVAEIIKDINPNDLYPSELKEMVGEWTLDIGDVNDVITIEIDGSIKSEKFGNGTITILAEGAKIILIVFDDKLELRRESETVFTNEKLAIKLYKGK